MTRLIIANLDCEQEYANETAPRKLPAPVRRMLSAAGTLMTAFARPGDTLWTPEPVRPERIIMAPAQSMRFVSGPPAETGHTAVLPWAETRTVARARTAAGTGGATAGNAGLATDAPWSEVLWSLHPDPAIARRCNDRRYCFALSRELGIGLPGAAILRSVDDLVHHLAANGHCHGYRDTWVLEAPFCASGRMRLRRRGRDLDDAAKTRAARMFKTFGELVFQPWVDRIGDLGCTGLIHHRDRWEVFTPHGLDTDAAGVFRGITVGDPHTWPEHGEPPPWLENAAIAVHNMAGQVARALARDGYVGPFSIDGFVYRDASGTTRIHPMCEINARLSFGFVARALAAAHPGPVRLRLGPDMGPAPAPGTHRIPLLEPDPDEPTAAWLEYGATPRMPAPP